MKKLLLLISFFTMAQSSISQAEGYTNTGYVCQCQILNGNWALFIKDLRSGKIDAYGPYRSELPCLYDQSSRPECPKSTDRSGGGNG